MASKDPITCHILDTTTGRPAQAVRVRLETANLSFESLTDADGRIKAWLPRGAGGAAPTGDEVPALTLRDVLGQQESVSTWTLRFDTAGYFGETATFFPEAVVVFRVEKGQQHHVPLLLGPYSYTTYRGS